jgi:hypothetical protein
MTAVKTAFSAGFKTSLSIEPYLGNPLAVIQCLKDYITESIWVGIMSKAALTPSARTVYNQNKMDDLYSKEYIQTHLPSWEQATDGKLRLKDSVRNILGVTG